MRRHPAVGPTRLAAMWGFSMCGMYENVHNTFQALVLRAFEIAALFNHAPLFHFRHRQIVIVNRDVGSDILATESTDLSLWADQLGAVRTLLHFPRIQLTSLQSVSIPLDN